MLFELTTQQTQFVSGGNNMEITSDMPEFCPRTFEKFYTIIIKSLCDYHQPLPGEAFARLV